MLCPVKPQCDFCCVTVFTISTKISHAHSNGWSLLSSVRIPSTVVAIKPGSTYIDCHPLMWFMVKGRIFVGNQMIVVDEIGSVVESLRVKYTTHLKRDVFGGPFSLQMIGRMSLLQSGKNTLTRFAIRFIVGTRNC